MANFWFLYNKSDGSMYSHYLGDADEWTNIPDGCDVLGPIPDTDTAARQAYNFPNRYGVKDGVLSIILGDADLLADIRLYKNVELEIGYNQAINSGFQVTLGTTTYTIGWKDKDKLNLQLTNTSIDKGDQVFPIYYTDINGNPFQLMQQSDLDLIESVATKFYVAQHQQIQSLKAKVSTSTLDTIDSIVWTDAAY